MPVSPRSTSRFLNSKPVLTRDGKPTFGIMSKFKFLNRDNLNESQIGNFTVPSDMVGRPYRIAEEIYNDANLHWIITMFNRVENPFGWPLNRQVIQYPLPEVVSEEI